MAQWNKDTQSYRAQDTTNFEVFICADEHGNIGACGSSLNNEINISAGLTPGMANVHKFGAVNTTSATYDTVWTKGGEYVFPTAAIIAVSNVIVLASSTLSTLATAFVDVL